MDTGANISHIQWMAWEIDTVLWTNRMPTKSQYQVMTRRGATRRVANGNMSCHSSYLRIRYIQMHKPYANFLICIAIDLSWCFYIRVGLSRRKIITLLHHAAMLLHCSISYEHVVQMITCSYSYYITSSMTAFQQRFQHRACICIYD